MVLERFDLDLWSNKHEYDDASIQALLGWVKFHEDGTQTYDLRVLYNSFTEPHPDLTPSLRVTANGQTIFFKEWGVNGNEPLDEDEVFSPTSELDMGQDIEYCIEIKPFGE